MILVIGFFSFCNQPISEKENFEPKPVVLCSKIDFVSQLGRGAG